MLAKCFSTLPQIVGSSSGNGVDFAGSVGCDSGSNTISLSFIALPFPFSFAATGAQQSAQISYALPSISRSKHFFGSPHRSQTIMRFLQVTRASTNHLPQGRGQTRFVPTSGTGKPDKGTMLQLPHRAHG